MRVVFRADASTSLGSGHVMRCLTMADALRQQGTTVSFVCMPLAGNMIEQIDSRGFMVHTLDFEQDDAIQTRSFLQSLLPSWLIVDHYHLDENWERIQRSVCNSIMVIDDLADRPHDCDLLLDQTYQRESVAYQGLVPQHCSLLLGTNYALLRPEFNEWRTLSLARRSTPVLKQLLMTFGGSDPDNITARVMQMFLRYKSLPQECKLMVIMGAQSPHHQSISSLASQLPYPCEIRTNIPNMAELMANSDLCITAAGTTSWEAACLGLPTAMTAIAENQHTALKALSAEQLVLQFDGRKLPHSLEEKLNQVITTPDPLLEHLSLRFSKVCDGLGIQRVLKYLS